MGIFDFLKKKENVEIKELSNFVKWSKEPSSLSDALEIKTIFSDEVFRVMYIYYREHHEFSEKIMNGIGEEFHEMDILKACVASHFCGVIIEESGKCSIGYVMVDLFEKVINLSYELILKKTNIEDEDWDMLYEKCPDEVKAFKGAELLTLAVMDVITRQPECRYYLRKKNLYEKMEMLKPYINSIKFALMAHDACYDYKVLVLCPETKKGFYMKAYDLDNCFYLITLLEAEIYKKGWAEDYCLNKYEFDEDLYNAAMGYEHPKKLMQIYAHCSYHNYFEIKTEKLRQTSSALSNMIFGEMPPEYIPKYNDCPILIMSRDSIDGRRGWDSNFTFKYHEGISPHIEILNELTEKEVNEFLEKLTGDDIMCDNIIGIYNEKMLQYLNKEIEDSILIDNSIVIPEINLTIKSDVQLCRNKCVQAELHLSHDSFIEPLAEFVIGLGSTDSEALENAAHSFCSAALTGIRKALKNEDGEYFESSFNNVPKKFKLYRSKKAVIGQKEMSEEYDYFDIIKEEIRKRLGNKPLYWIKVYLSKTSQVSCECRINDVVNNEITKLLNEIAEKWNIKSMLYDEKQYFVLIQDESTYVPYKFTREEVMDFTDKALDLYKECDSEEKYDNLGARIFDFCKDYSLTCELERFIPEILCELVCKGIYADSYNIVLGKDNMLPVYKDASTTYNWIFQACEKKVNERYFTNDEFNRIIGTSATLKLMSNAVDKGGKTEDVYVKCAYMFGEEYSVY